LEVTVARRDDEDPDDRETRESRRQREQREEAEREAEARLRRAREFCTVNRLLRLEVESPSGKLVTYKWPADFLEAFAADEVALDRRKRDR
jgi:hypothetical protein